MHTTYICKIKEENLPKLFIYRIWRKSLRTQERVRLIHGKRAIGVRAIEVPLYMLSLTSAEDQEQTSAKELDIKYVNFYQKHGSSNLTG